MSLDAWFANRWIVTHEPSREETADLFAVVDRDLADAAIPRLSADWRLGITFNAALQLATLTLAAEGYRPGRERGHERALRSLEHTVGAARTTVEVLDAVRRKRNQINYEHAGTTSDKETQELYDTVVALRGKVVRWLRATHPDLVPPDIDA